MVRLLRLVWRLAGIKVRILSYLQNIFKCTCNSISRIRPCQGWCCGGGTHQVLQFLMRLYLNWQSAGLPTRIYGIIPRQMLQFLMQTYHKTNELFPLTGIDIKDHTFSFAPTIYRVCRQPSCQRSLEDRLRECESHLPDQFLTTVVLLLMVVYTLVLRRLFSNVR